MNIRKFSELFDRKTEGVSAISPGVLASTTIRQSGAQTRSDVMEFEVISALTVSNATFCVKCARYGFYESISGRPGVETRIQRASSS